MICERCNVLIPQQNQTEYVSYCNCGWEKRKPRPRTFALKAIFSFLIIGLLIYAITWFHWGSYTNPYLSLQIRNVFFDLTETDHKVLAKICKRLEKTACEKKSYENILSINPNHTLYRVKLAILQSQLNQHRNALANFNKVREIGYNDELMEFHYSKSLKRLKQQKSN